MIPIFIITCDRLEVLKKSMQSYYDYIKTHKLESEGIKVYRWKENLNYGEKRNLRRNDGKIRGDIQDYFKNHPISNYVVTDPDILLDDVNGDILEVYAYFLEKLPQITIAGPMLRIDDIPDYYPKKEKLLTKGYHRRFHSESECPVNIINYKGTKIKYIFAPIHTTFGMFRKGSQWKGRRAIRTFAPYSAKHLDWYVDPENLTEDYKYYMKHGSTNAHWSKWSLK